jgi:hypothetical protein
MVKLGGAVPNSDLDRSRLDRLVVLGWAVVAKRNAPFGTPMPLMYQITDLGRATNA